MYQNDTIDAWGFTGTAGNNTIVCRTVHQNRAVFTYPPLQSLHGYLLLYRHELGEPFFTDFIRDGIRQFIGHRPVYRRIGKTPHPVEFRLTNEYQEFPEVLFRLPRKTDNKRTAYD